MSVTPPSAPYLSICNQSPTPQHAVGGELDTRHQAGRMGSLNTSIRTAVMGPRPLNRKSGDLPSSRAIIRMPTRMLATSFTPGRCRVDPAKPGMAAPRAGRSSGAEQGQQQEQQDPELGQH